MDDEDDEDRADPVADHNGHICVVCGGQHWYYQHLADAIIAGRW